jgi:tellurite resistance protein
VPPGLLRFVSGLILAGVAGFLSWLSLDAADSAGGYVVWTGGIVVGGSWALLGGFRFVSHLWRSARDKSYQKSRFFLPSLVFSCSYVAAADGEVSVGELQAIQATLRKRLGLTPKMDELRFIAGSTTEKDSLTTYSGGLALLDIDEKRWVLKEAIRTAAANGGISLEARARLEQLQAWLKLPAGTLADYLAAAS